MFPEERFKEGQEALPVPSVTEVCAVCADIAHRVSRVLLQALEGTESFKVWAALELPVVLIRWLQAGRRLEETVPLTAARHRRIELEALGATVYWSERLVNG